MNQFISTSPHQQQVSALLELRGHSQYGFCKLREPLFFEFYENWLKEGLNGEMEYLIRHAPVKKNPDQLLPKAKSAIVIAFKYLPHPKPQSQPSALRIAFYARGEDYHTWIKEKLEAIIKDLRELFPDEVFLAATDSSPVMERDFAHQAGLGWFGKNTCLIDKKNGSHFLLGEILTSVDLFKNDVQKPLPQDHCGTCNRCITACPTQAIIEPRKIDARRCISYLTIESKTVPPRELREAMGDNFFGCDICQNVCPWNEKIHGFKVKDEASVKLKPSLEQSKELENELREILTSSNKQLEKKYQSTPLERAKGFGLKRNALVVAANMGLKELKSEITAYKNDPKLGELAAWALSRLDGLN